MIQYMMFNYNLKSNRNYEVTPPPRTNFQPKLSGISIKILDAYILWQNETKHVPKMLRYSIGSRIDGLFAEVIELVSEAMFSPQDKRESYVSEAIKKNDVLKFMLYAIFELKGIEELRFLTVSEAMEEVGKMLFGWKNQLVKQNHPNANSATDGKH